jgi:hypothetical protein
VAGIVKETTPQQTTKVWCMLSIPPAREAYLGRSWSEAKPRKKVEDPI